MTAAPIPRWPPCVRGWKRRWWRVRGAPTWIGSGTAGWWGRPRLSGGYAHFSGGAGQNHIDDSGNRVPDDDVGTFQRLWSDKQYGENLDRAPFGAWK